MPIENYLPLFFYSRWFDWWQKSNTNLNWQHSIRPCESNVDLICKQGCYYIMRYWTTTGSYYLWHKDIIGRIHQRSPWQIQTVLRFYRTISKILLKLAQMDIGFYTSIINRSEYWMAVVLYLIKKMFICIFIRLTCLQIDPPAK
jgi:hypothetical protein